MNTPEAKLRKVLIIAYHFPPDASIGTFRTLKFVKYLRQYGWDSVIVTVDPKNEFVEPKDAALLEEVPHTAVVLRPRALSSQCIASWWRRVVIKTVAHDSGSESVLTRETGRPQQFPKLKQIIHLVLMYLSFPDRCSGWFPFAVSRGLVAVWKHRPNVIYATAPPFTGTLVGLTLSLLTGKPLVLDFRDPWVVEGFSLGLPPVLERFARLLEYKAFKNSSRIICVTDEQAEQAKRRAPPGCASRIHVIPNGYDPEDFVNLRPTTHHEGFRILYTGSFYSGFGNPKTFLEALVALKQSHPSEFSNMSVRFVGDSRWAQENAPWLNRLDLDGHVEFIGFRPHRDIIDMLSQADILLVLGFLHKGDSRRLPAKVFEYLAIQKPILALVHEGETARFVGASGIGVIANPEDPQEIADKLLGLYHAIRQGSFPIKANPELLRRYDRRELTQQLACLFDEVCSSQKREPSRDGNSASEVAASR